MKRTLCERPSAKYQGMCDQMPDTNLMPDKNLMPDTNLMPGARLELVCKSIEEGFKGS
jgi:hypothetical protein